VEEEIVTDESQDRTGSLDQVVDTSGDQPRRLRPAVRRWVWGWRPLAVVVAVFALIQLVPYRIGNPPVVAEPDWDSPRTRELAVRACYNCHSNQTESTWYSGIAPVSWWLTNHVDEGRSNLNFSEWNARQAREAREAAEAVERGSMPPSYYTWFGLHSEAKLTPEERSELIAGLEKTFANSRS
jgi:hypothetical protein